MSPEQYNRLTEYPCICGRKVGELIDDCERCLLVDEILKLRSSLDSLSRWSATCGNKNSNSWLESLLRRVEDAQVLTGLMIDSEREQVSP